MAKHKYKNKSKNKNNNNSPAVAPKAKFSAPEKKSETKKTESTKKVSEKKRNTPTRKFDTKKLAIIISAAVVLIAAIVVILIVLLGGRIPELAISEYNGQNATVSVVSDITVDEETQLERYNEIKRKIKGDKKDFKFYCRPSIEIDEKYKEGVLMFSNLTMNDCTMIVTLMDEEDDIIFRSMGIAPGKCMQRIGLTKTLNFGKHNVTLYVTGYDNDTFEIIGTQYMKIDLLFGDEYSASEEAETSTTEPTINPSVTRPAEATSATQRTTQPTTLPPTQSVTGQAASTSAVRPAGQVTAANGTTKRVVKPNVSTTRKVATATNKVS